MGTANHPTSKRRELIRRVIGNFPGGRISSRTSTLVVLTGFVGGFLFRRINGTTVRFVSRTYTRHFALVGATVQRPSPRASLAKQTRFDRRFRSGGQRPFRIFKTKTKRDRFYAKIETDALPRNDEPDAADVQIRSGCLLNSRVIIICHPKPTMVSVRSLNNSERNTLFVVNLRSLSKFRAAKKLLRRTDERSKYCSNIICLRSR